MNDHDQPAFDEKLAEMAQAFRATWPIPTGLHKHLWLAARGFDLATVRQACDDLIGALEYFPKPAELRRACEVYGHTSTDERLLRCLHLDYTRAALPDDMGERHWRCPARFGYAPDQLYCPAHRQLYPKDSQPATPEEISGVFAEALAAHPESSFLRDVAAQRARRLAAGEHPVQAAIQALLSAVGRTMPDASDSAEVVQARKMAMLAKARNAGLLDTEE